MSHTLGTGVESYKEEWRNRFDLKQRRLENTDGVSHSSYFLEFS